MCSEQHADGKMLCEKCWLPICADCATHLTNAELPPLSYANDMWTGYGLERIYRQNVTAIELLCASPCLTSMVLMSMESKYKQEANVAIFDEKAHMARHRYGARGNLITFPLPVEELLQKLQEHLAPTEVPDALPRSGKQLCDVFRVILKTNKTGKTTDQEIKTLIHQARVRRQARCRGSQCLFVALLFARLMSCLYVAICIECDTMGQAAPIRCVPPPGGRGFNS